MIRSFYYPTISLFGILVAMVTCSMTRVIVADCLLGNVVYVDQSTGLSQRRWLVCKLQRDVYVILS